MVDGVNTAETGRIIRRPNAGVIGSRSPEGASKPLPTATSENTSTAVEQLKPVDKGRQAVIGLKETLQSLGDREAEEFLSGFVTKLEQLNLEARAARDDTPGEHRNDPQIIKQNLRDLRASTRQS